MNESEVQKYDYEEVERNAFLTLIVVMKVRGWEEVLGERTPRLVEILD